MWNLLIDLFAPERYIPHGHCYLWQTPLVGLHVISDTLIALAYYSIPLTLIYFIQKRKDVPFRGIFILFSAFIVSCGTTHVMGIWTLWYPAYWLSGLIKGATALVSVYTALELVPLIPEAIAMPSPEQLAALNRELESQILERQNAEQAVRQLNTELERRVIERTAELEKANEKLQLEITERQQAEQALRESNHLNEQITHLTPDILYIYDLIEQRNIYCNRFISEILGYTPDEIQQMGNQLFTQLLHPDDREIVNQHLHRCLSLGNGSFLEVEYRMKDSQGKWHWLHSRETIFENTPQEKPWRTIGIASDITERKEDELKLQEVNTQLAERVQELEGRTEEMIRLGEMTDLLQACLTVSEAEAALGDLLKPLFPHSSGAVFTIKASRDLMEIVTFWGTSLNSQRFFQPDECWALRRGTAHQGVPSAPSLYCQHIHFEEQPNPTLCVPMMAQGETLGLLYLSFPQIEPMTLAKRRLAETVSKQIAISLANLKLRETLQYQSFQDSLTGLFNRRYLEASMARELHRVARSNQSLGVIMLDVDHFKRFNDTHGHKAGDAVLQAIGMFLNQNVRESDIACRYGGEELTVIMPEASLEDTVRRAEDLRKGIEHLIVQYSNQTLGSITASVGVAAYPEHGATMEQLFRAADEALYQAKQQGRNRVIWALKE